MFNFQFCFLAICSPSKKCSIQLSISIYGVALTLCMPWVGDVFLHIGLNVDNSIMYLTEKKPFSNRIDSFHGVMYVKQLIIKSPEFFFHLQLIA
jgi:hypothetical protein